MEACSDIQLLNILRIIKMGITTITIIVPVILVIFIILDILKTTASGDVDTKKLFAKISKKVIAAVVIFLLPVVLNVVLSLFGDDLYYVNCYNNANKEYINTQAKQVADELIAEARQICSTQKNENAYEKARKAVKAIPDKSIRDSYSSTITDLRSKCRQK